MGYCFARWPATDLDWPCCQRAHASDRPGCGGREVALSRTVTPLSPNVWPHVGGVGRLSSHRRRRGRVSERGFRRKADSVPMRAALPRRRKRPVYGAGGRAGHGGHRQVRARRLVSRRETRRGRGGRREERLNGSLAVRHEILGVGPEHRFILQSRRGKHTQDEKMGRRRETKEKVIRLM